MNCIVARDRLLELDQPRDALGGESDLARHVAACPACRQFVRKLTRLEQAVWELPVPAETETARADFLARLTELKSNRRATPNLATTTHRQAVVALPFVRPRRASRTARWIAAAAALLVVAVGISVWQFQREPTDVELADDAPPPDAESPLVDRLIAWNLDLARLPSPEDRRDAYTAQVETLKTAIERDDLADEDREFAQSLIEHGSLLAQNDDPVADADLFSHVADTLLDRIDSAVGRSDADGVHRYTALFSRVAEHGVHAPIARAEIAPAKAAPADRAKRVEKIEHRNQERTVALASMVDRAPAGSKKQLKRAMEASEKKPKGKGKKAAAVAEPKRKGAGK